MRAENGLQELSDRVCTGSGAYLIEHILGMGETQMLFGYYADRPAKTTCLPSASCLPVRCDINKNRNKVHAINSGCSGPSVTVKAGASSSSSSQTTLNYMLCLLFFFFFPFFCYFSFCLPQAVSQQNSLVSPSQMLCCYDTSSRIACEISKVNDGMVMKMETSDPPRALLCHAMPCPCQTAYLPHPPLLLCHANEEIEK